MVYTKEIPQKYEVDVFVAGGGPAGVAAAVAAARQGRTVFLAEGQGAFGGTGTLGLVPCFMQFTDGINFLSGGIGKEIHDAVSPHRDHRRDALSIKVEQLKLIYDEMVQKAGVQFSFFTNLIDVIATDGHVDSVILSGKSGVFSVKAKVYIDCTGDGDLCAWAGNRFEKGDAEGLTMPSTLCTLWANIDFNKRNGRDDQNIEKAISDGVFTNEDRHLPGMFEINHAKGIGGGNIGHCFAVDATDETSLTKAMLWGRKSMAEYETYYKKYLSGFENMELVVSGSILGVRESRRITGEYVLNINDFKTRAVFEDEIGRYSYPVDIHIMKPDKKSFEAFDEEFMNLRYGVGESYGIPYRALLPKDLSNVLVAGRCMSTDRQMQASIRVMPGCYITGQAAGVAASLTCKAGDTRAFSITELQDKLKEMGGYLPNSY